MRKEYFKSKDNKSYDKKNSKSEKNRSNKSILIIPYKILYTIPKYTLLAKLLIKPFSTTKDITK